MRIRLVEGRAIIWIPLRPKLGLRGLMILVLISSLAICYVTSYVRLSRRGLREAQFYGMEGFLYVPFAEAQATEDLSRHYALSTFYAPVNWIDRTFLGGPGPTLCIMWRVTG
jgi:hypothetical protein